MGVRAVPEGGYVAFYRREYPGAVRLAGLLTGSASSSEDIAQEALMIVRGRFEELEQSFGVPSRRRCQSMPALAP